jgi:S1-C subfamily serine protease
LVLSPASNVNNFNGFPGFNNGPQSQTPQFNQALGSGFIWDTKGDIVTNNHVIDGATKIEVTFSDGTTVPATVVGADPYSDLAVIKVDVSADKLSPVTVADSTQVKVGEIAIAIGNPYGFEGSMTVGTVSGLGRDLPTSQVDQTSGASYSIPDVIQTDASINPGNSGGVLVNDQGQVIGVTSALESSSGSNSGIGFAIPAEIVSKVVPALISAGKYDHPYLGISGTDMSPDIAQAMNLPTDTRGALVELVTAGGPAAKAGLQASTTTVTINGVQGTVGGDVITAIDGQTIHSMSDIIAYLSIHTQVGQTITLTILRNGQTQTVQVTLGNRPSQ